ncbi:hypothetical protein D3C81_174070 [compost metagenome]
MSSIFNSDAWKKAVTTFKANKAATPTMPTAAVGVLSGASQQLPKQPLPTGLPQAAITAANNVKSGAASVPTVPAAATAAAQKMVTATAHPRTEQALTAQANLVNTPFSYNANADPAYQAALKAEQMNLAVNQKNTNAQLRATGQGKSSYSETVANQLAHQSEDNVANNILPQYAQQAYKQYQDSIGNQRNLYQDYNQQDFQNPITESQVTGNYLPAEAKQAIQNLLGLKAQAEAKGITKDARSQLSTEADAIRAQLQSLGIDPSFYGANRTAAQASANNPGIRTLAGQAQDQSVKNANLDAATTVSNTTGRAVSPQTDWQGLYRQAADPNTPLNSSQGNFNRQQTFNEGQQNWNNQFDQAKFDEDTRRYGLDYAIQQQQVDNSSSNVANSNNNDQFNQLMDVWKATGTAPRGLESLGVQPGTVYSAGAAAKASAPKTYEDYQSNIDKIAQRDSKTGALKNPDAVEEYIVTSDLSDYEQYRAYKAAGLKWPAGVPVPTKGE